MRSCRARAWSCNLRQENRVRHHGPIQHYGRAAGNLHADDFVRRNGAVFKGDHRDRRPSYPRGSGDAGSVSQRIGHRHRRARARRGGGHQSRAYRREYSSGAAGRDHHQPAQRQRRGCHRPASQRDAGTRRRRRQIRANSRDGAALHQRDHRRRECSVTGKRCAPDQAGHYWIGLGRIGGDQQDAVGQHGRRWHRRLSKFANQDRRRPAHDFVVRVGRLHADSERTHCRSVRRHREPALWERQAAGHPLRRLL